MARLLPRLYQRFQHIIHELGKFGVVGGCAFALDTVLYSVLLANGVETLTAKTIATVFAATAAFLGNRFWTWRHRERSGLSREYLLYFLFNAAGLGITLLTLRISHYWLGEFFPILQTPLADVISAQIVGNAMASVFRFWSYRRFVFVAAEPAATPARSAAGR